MYIYIYIYIYDIYRIYRQKTCIFDGRTTWFPVAFLEEIHPVQQLNCN